MTIPFTPFEDDDIPPRPRPSKGPDPIPDAGSPEGSEHPRPRSDASHLDDLRSDADEDDEPRLGTSPTISKADVSAKAPRRKARTGGSGGSGARRRSRPILGISLIVLVAVVFAGLPLLKSAFARTPKDRIGISYGGGPIEGVHFQKIVEPGHGLFFNGFFDSLYLYPADQLNYILAPKPTKDGKDTTPDAVVAPTSDRVNVSYQVAVYYRLNTDKLRDFHEEFGLRY